MTRYRISARPQYGPFGSATEAILFALLLDLPTDWEAVSESRGFTFPTN